jgi:hypothetical protein
MRVMMMILILGQCPPMADGDSDLDAFTPEDLSIIHNNIMPTAKLCVR